MAAGMIVVALTFAIGGSQLHGGAAFYAFDGLLIYTGSFAIGLGPVFWLLISEIYPVTIRGQAMSVATMANWGANFVVTISFLTLLSAIGNAGTFFLFAGLSIVALAYFQRQVPETKNRSLQDIERDLDLPERLDRAPPVHQTRHDAEHPMKTSSNDPQGLDGKVRDRSARILRSDALNVTWENRCLTLAVSQHGPTSRPPSGRLPPHFIGVNWPHHIFVNQDFKVVGAD